MGDIDKRSVGELRAVLMEASVDFSSAKTRDDLVRLVGALEGDGESPSLVVDEPEVDVEPDDGLGPVADAGQDEFTFDEMLADVARSHAASLEFRLSPKHLRVLVAVLNRLFALDDSLEPAELVLRSEEFDERSRMSARTIVYVSGGEVEVGRATSAQNGRNAQATVKSARRLLRRHRNTG